MFPPDGPQWVEPLAHENSDPAPSPDPYPPLTPGGGGCQLFKRVTPELVPGCAYITDVGMSKKRRKTGHRS